MKDLKLTDLFSEILKEEELNEIKGGTIVDGCPGGERTYANYCDPENCDGSFDDG